MSLDLMGMYESISETVRTYKNYYNSVQVPEDMPVDMQMTLIRSADEAFDGPARFAVEQIKNALIEFDYSDEEKEMGMEMTREMRDLMVIWTIMRVVSTMNNEFANAMANSIEVTVQNNVMDMRTAALIAEATAAMADKMEWHLASIMKAYFDDFLAA